MHATSYEATTTNCAPWCRDGESHVSAFSAGDQYCISEPRTIELNNLPLVPWADGTLRRQAASVYLLRDHEARSTTVEISFRDEPTASLALEDALDLSRAILDSVMAARG